MGYVMRPNEKQWVPTEHETPVARSMSEKAYLQKLEGSVPYLPCKKEQQHVVIGPIRTKRKDGRLVRKATEKKVLQNADKDEACW